jgi:hypothetical protein
MGANVHVVMHELGAKGFLGFEIETQRINLAHLRVGELQHGALFFPGGFGLQAPDREFLII